MAKQDILEKRIDLAGKGQKMNVKENFYVYSYEPINKLVEEQRADDNSSFTELHSANQHCSTHKVLSCLYYSLLGNGLQPWRSLSLRAHVRTGQ
jgi:hypothetical protein